MAYKQILSQQQLLYRKTLSGKAKKKKWKEIKKKKKQLDKETDRIKSGKI